MERVEMIYLPVLVKKPGEDIIFSQDALSGYCLIKETWNAVPGRSGLAPTIPAAEYGFMPKLSWREIQVWANSVGTACPGCMDSVHTASQQAHGGSSWRSGVLLNHIVASACKAEKLCCFSLCWRYGYFWRNFLLQESQCCQHLPEKGRKRRRAIRWGKEPLLCSELDVSTGCCFVMSSCVGVLLFRPLAWFLPAPCGTFSQLSL